MGNSVKSKSSLSFNGDEDFMVNGRCKSKSCKSFNERDSTGPTGFQHHVSITKDPISG